MRVIRGFILIVFLLFITNMTNAAESVMEVDKLYIETEKMVRTNRGYYVPDNSIPKNNFNLGLNLKDRFKGIFYVNSLISTTTDESQFRYIALDTEVGIDTTIGIDVYFRHYSGHMLDSYDRSNTRFPEENVVGLRFYLIK